MTKTNKNQKPEIGQDEKSKFIAMIARMTKEGEIAPGSDCEHIWENDDCYDTLHSLISEAREISGISDYPTADDEEEDEEEE